jgi:hypothetical protein
VLDYNKYTTGVDRSDQMLPYYSLERKTIKWWKKLPFNLFDLVVVKAHILHNKKSKKKMSLDIFHEKVAEGLLTSAGTEIQVQGQISSPAGRLVRRDHSRDRVPVTHAKLEGKSQHSCRVSADRGKHQIGKTMKKCTAIHCCKYDARLCRGQCFEVYHTKLNYWE